MRKYIGTKEVMAERMNEKEAVGLGYARANEDNHEWRQGYHVVYADGYQSWSPRDVFEEAYKRADTVEDRLSLELYDLQVKISRLRAFLSAEEAPRVSVMEADLLLKQLKAMEEYGRLLGERIALHQCSLLTCVENKEQCAQQSALSE